MGGVYVVFHSPSWPEVSPAVLLPEVADLKGLLAEVLPSICDFTNATGIACAAFVAAVFTRFALSGQSVEVFNGGLLRDGRPADDPDDAALFREYDRQMAEFAGWQPPPVLVCMDHPPVATRGGAELWRREPPAAIGS